MYGLSECVKRVDSPPGKEGQRAEERGERGGRKNRDAIAEPPLMPREAHPCSPESMNRLGFLLEVIHQDVMAEVQRGGEVGFAPADLGHLLHEIHEVMITGE